MKHHRRSRAALFGAFILAAAACSSSKGGGGGGGGGQGGSGGSDDLKWYATCGDPVCSMHSDHPGVSACAAEQAGGACTTAGAQCDPNDSCNKLLLCAATDPTAGGCPISRARYKHDIRYLPEAELRRAHDDLMDVRLATWRYNHEDATAREHLGFIIDDNPASPSVARDGEHVDLYGYTSMAVAAAQVQDRRMQALEAELAALREEMRALRQTSAACGAASR
jgi:hypothetical protein